MTMLRYDEIPPDRRTIGDATGRLGDEGLCGELAVALAVWMARDDCRADPDARRAANVAVDSIDLMLLELHRLRERLIGEIRTADDANERRLDELLARCKEEPR